MCEWKEQRIEEFRKWLSELPDDDPICEQHADPLNDSCDMFTLFSEIAALRQEVRLQNRKQEKSIKTLDAFSDWVSSAADFFKSRDENRDEFEARVRKNQGKRMAMHFLDVRDSLARGATAAAKAARPKGFFKRKSREMEALAQGHEMALKKFDTAMKEAGIEPIKTVGEPFDPKIMKAVAVEENASLPSGCVIKEVSCGFRMSDDFLKIANVIVSK